ncbi:hypothetical protein [Nannocystis pusilla]|uniref:hypothetical protein n=1 Tax=Nannocystis pusilla TaxID=889268 RepID=UPI003B7EDA63
MKFTEEELDGVEPTEAHETSTVHQPSRADTRAGLLIAERYRIMERLGKGGMAAVYRAVDRESGVEYAVYPRPSIHGRPRHGATLSARSADHG